MFDGLQRAIRLRTILRGYAVRTMEELGHPPLAEDGHGVRTLVVGNDPVRVLLFGSGTLVGWGARTRAESVDGQLAAALAEASGRGVVLESRAQPHVAMAGAVQSLGGAGFTSFRVAVWAPSFLEGFERLSVAGWRRELTAMLDSIRTRTSIPLVIALSPTPLGMHPSAVVSRPWAARLNRLVCAVAERYPDVRTVVSEPFPPGSSVEMLAGDPQYYRKQAARLAPEILAAIGVVPVVAGAGA